MFLYIPATSGFWKLTNVQRGIVFMWFLMLLLCFVVGTIKLIAGWTEMKGEYGEE